MQAKLVIIKLLLPLLANIIFTNTSCNSSKDDSKEPTAQSNKPDPAAENKLTRTKTNKELQPAISNDKPAAQDDKLPSTKNSKIDKAADGVLLDESARKKELKLLEKIELQFNEENINQATKNNIAIYLAFTWPIDPRKLESIVIIDYKSFNLIVKDKKAEYSVKSIYKGKVIKVSQNSVTVEYITTTNEEFVVEYKGISKCTVKEGELVNELDELGKISFPSTLSIIMCSKSLTPDNTFENYFIALDKNVQRIKCIKII